MYIDPQSRTRAFGSEFSQRWKVLQESHLQEIFKWETILCLSMHSHSVLVFEPGPQRQWEFELATTGQLFLYNY